MANEEVVLSSTSMKLEYAYPEWWMSYDENCS